MKPKLPKIFEKFEESRKKGFILAKEYKENGGKIAGYLCSYTPHEIIEAAGVALIGICGSDEEGFQESEKVLPKNMCPLIKGTYGMAASQKCPYTYFSDIIIGETTCDGKKKMYELLNDIKETYVLHLPQGQQRSYSADIWYQEIILLKQKLEEKFDVEITEEKLKESIHTWNELRQVTCEMYEMQMNIPPVMTGCEMLLALQENTYLFDTRQRIENIRNIVERAKKEYVEGNRKVSSLQKRILVTGCPMGGVIEKVGMTIEENGGVIVCVDDCSGERTNRLMIDENSDNLLRAISDAYLQINCSVMSPNTQRLKNTKKMIEKYHVDGVIEVVLQCCHTFEIEAELMRRTVTELNIPYMKITTDYSQTDRGQLSTRIAAFMEML